ncbi:MAG: PQQ-dependent sugar dehydrogenase [Flavobacteriales bacterium]|nr:PQQ-dependent sugar dehydrogenase [Flavobacteriales bacterium]
MAGEQGLLGLAFDPNYANNGFFYVNYIFGGGTGSTRISRFQVSADPNVADTASEQVIWSWPQPNTNHNGGDLDFGPDGLLYIPLGDGGEPGDVMNNARIPAIPWATSYAST